MSTTNNVVPTTVQRPTILARSIALMKPVTWFAPTWAFLCGAVASGAAAWSLTDASNIVIGMVMAGPILCGMSQVINDYFDKEVDAINEPQRPIPSGIVSLRQVIVTIIVLMTIGFGIGLYLGRGVSLLVAIGLLLAIGYSAPPIRAKQNAWFGNAFAGVAYEGLAWLAGHLAFAALTPQSFLIAALYSLGTHGIMSINDFKSVKGDREIGIMTIPVQYGVKRAALITALTMDIAQIGIIVAFLIWGLWIPAAALGIVVLIQLPLQWQFVKNPMANYLKFSAFGVLIFVIGMLVAALGVRVL